MPKRMWAAVVLAVLAASPAGAQPNPSFNLVNRSDSAINEVYATSAGRANWGRNRLGQADIAPGRSFPIRLPADGNCIYDIRVVYANGRSEARRALNTCAVDDVMFPARPPAGPRPPARTPAGREEGRPNL